MDNISLSKSIKVKVNDEEIEVRKLPLGRYAELLGFIKKILPKIQEDYKDIFDSNKTVELTPMLIIDMISKNIDVIIELIGIGTSLEEEYIRNQVGGFEAYEILKAIIGINGLDKLIVKKK